MREKTALLIDGYVDEPACFGVPPYISPYVRYCAGVLAANGWETKYVICDEWRTDKERFEGEMAESEIVLVIMGTTVPGRYRGGSPLTFRELGEIASRKRRGGHLILGGPVRWGYTLRGGGRAAADVPEGVDLVARGDVEASLDIYCRTKEWEPHARAVYAWLDGERVAVLGADIMKSHPSYPNVIAEMELSRGCDRAFSTGLSCSYCTEGINGRYEERGTEGVLSETAALSAAGITAYRLGKCANILAWGGIREDIGFRPRPERLYDLYSGIRSTAQNLSVLHTDNCNPATIARFPHESARCVEIIADFCTEGDGLSQGLENLDPNVRAANRLKVSFEEALTAVRIINEHGGWRRSPRSLPSLLPGLNFLFGLAGETASGLEWNTNFLRKLLEEGLSVRRINIRRAMVFPDAALWAELAVNPPRIKERDYRRWKKWVRDEVDPAMLARVAPDGTILKGVIAEERAGKVMFGRQLGSYPPLVGIVSENMRAGDRADVMVTGRGGRSLTAVRYPLDINTATKAELMALPGIGSARAEFLLSKVPCRSSRDVEAALAQMDLPEAGSRLMPYFKKFTQKIPSKNSLNMFRNFS
ncbi:MAG: radical SAM protein [Synergistaceae bacterium]|nr:radical SAM protein [Synergistaceae bacterium]